MSQEKRDTSSRRFGWRTEAVPVRFSAVPAVLLIALAGACEQKQPMAAPPPPEVAVSRPMMHEVTDSADFTGTLAALESVEVRARVAGFLDQMHFVPRAKVNKGDLLFTIDQRPFQLALANAIADRDSKKAQLVKAEFDADKTSGLYTGGMASADEFTKNNASRDDLRAQLAAAEAQTNNAQLRLDWCSVTAPIHGRISRNLIDPGNIVDADKTVLATIVNDDDVYAYFNASERDILNIREETARARAAGGQPTTQRDVSSMRPAAYMALMTETGYPHAGVIDYVAPELDSSTGTIQLRARFPNPDGTLVAGLFGRIRVPLGAPYKALTVSDRALGSDQGQRYVLTVNDKNVVEYRAVKVGLLDSGLRVIIEGIDPQDRVIVNGLQRVRPGVTVKPQEIPMPMGPAVSAKSSKPISSQPSPSTSQPIRK
jgi:membrane fusion protein, multidrug efflux system